MNDLRNLQRCEHPNRIINPYTHEVMYVPCRTCNSCLNQRSNHWKKRVNDECKKYRYVMFFTLTYSNDNLPLYLPITSEDGTVEWYSNRDGSKFNENDKLQDSEIHPIRVQNSNVIGIPHVSKYDIVCFVKRLRSHINYYFKKHNITENEKIRYFICSEYGPRTLRPHYHGLFFFDSEVISRRFGTFLRKAWSYGNQDYSLVNSSAPSYVAKYINGYSRLPKVLLTEYTKPFHLSSKNPCIGYCKDDEKEVFKNFNTGTYGYTKFDKDTQQFYFVAPPSYVENRYFPKCREFGSLSYFEKLRIYSYAYDLTQQERFLDANDIRRFVKFHFPSAVDRHATYACLKYCQLSDLTPADYVRNIELYYSEKELYQLGLHYTYQQRYIDDYHLPISNLLSFDLTSYERIPYYKHDFNASPLRDIFISYGVDPNLLYDSDGIIIPEYVESLKQENTDFYRKNVLFNQKVHSDSFKSKTLNESINPLIFTNLT
ncbi:rolling circle replication-associated protein [Prevotella corporis]|uniref:rolling circle replication-associated protein n=1 Tax=Prevotella corporis TaxID=28128 RepID=UPI0023F76832|nr:hypothetical protein [Prevotella corporis]